MVPPAAGLRRFHEPSLLRATIRRRNFPPTPHSKTIERLVTLASNLPPWVRRDPVIPQYRVGLPRLAPLGQPGFLFSGIGAAHPVSREPGSGPPPTTTKIAARSPTPRGRAGPR